jgi:hypothetical protein
MVVEKLINLTTVAWLGNLLKAPIMLVETGLHTRIKNKIHQE